KHRPKKRISPAEPKERFNEASDNQSQPEFEKYPKTMRFKKLDIPSEKTAEQSPSKAPSIRKGARIQRAVAPTSSRTSISSIRLSIETRVALPTIKSPRRRTKPMAPSVARLNFCRNWDQPSSQPCPNDTSEIP